MDKGLGIIVAVEKKNGSLVTDSVVNCDAKAFSISSPCILQKANFSRVSNDKPLYLCGHGTHDGKKISGFTMKEIASMLKNSGYSGKQTLYVASCYAARKHHGKNTAEVLQQELLTLGITCDCIAISRDTTIVIDMPGCEVDIASVKFATQHRRAFNQFQNELFNEFPIEQSKSDLNKNYERVMNWNVDVVHNNYALLFALNGEITPILFSVLLAFIFAFIKLPAINIPLALIWIIAELIALRGWTASIVLLTFAMLTAINTGLMWLVITRLVLCLFIVVVVDTLYLKKFISKST